MKHLEYKWHQLEEGRAYMSVHVGSGLTLQVLTTPISEGTYEEHKKLLEEKIKNLKETAG